MLSGPPGARGPFTTSNAFWHQCRLFYPPDGQEARKETCLGRTPLQCRAQNGKDQSILFIRALLRRSQPCSPTNKNNNFSYSASIKRSDRKAITLSGTRVEKNSHRPRPRVRILQIEALDPYSDNKYTLMQLRAVYS